MEKYALAVLLIICTGAVIFHFGSKHGRRLAIKDFSRQMESHKTFYEHNLKSCGSKKFVHVID